MQTNEHPLVSIITVVYNGEQYLEDTILSVIGQTYENIEYIIIDGGSTDSTIDIIKKYEDKIDYWISEKDKGIYDAMNKGITVATGEWINFMNAGDYFYTNNLLKDIFLAQAYENVSVLYGNHEVRYPNKKRIAKAGYIKNIWKGSQFCHQSAFISSRHHKLNKFNISNHIGADFEFFYTSYKNGIKFQHIDIIASTVSSRGVSDIKRIESIVGWWHIINKNTNTNFYYIGLILKEMLKARIKKILVTKK